MYKQDVRIGNNIQNYTYITIYNEMYNETLVFKTLYLPYELKT